MHFVLKWLSKEELTLSNNDDVATGVTTRVLSGFHWKCPRCGFLNGGWRSTCTNLDCNGEYEASHSDMLLGFVKAMTNVIKLVGAEGGPIDPNRIEIKKTYFRQLLQSLGMRRLLRCDIMKRLEVFLWILQISCF